MNITLRKASPADAVMGGRCGTCLATLAQLDAALGEPTYIGSADNKVTRGWIFKTPRGLAEVRDYWWNGAAEQSIAAQSFAAARWLAAHLRTLGFRAASGMAGDRLRAQQ